jgi:hypothetical protein
MGWTSALFVSRVLMAHMARLHTSRKVTTSRPGFRRDCSSVRANLEHLRIPFSLTVYVIFDLHFPVGGVEDEDCLEDGLHEGRERGEEGEEMVLELEEAANQAEAVVQKYPGL